MNKDWLATSIMLILVLLMMLTTAYMWPQRATTPVKMFGCEQAKECR